MIGVIERGYSYLFLFKRKASRFLPLSVMLTVGVLLMSFIKFRKFPFIPVC